MREARARGSREEGETRRRANAEAMREARARESREEGETRRRANAEAMREARARRPRIADRSGSTVVHVVERTQTKVAEPSEATCTVHNHAHHICSHIFLCTLTSWFAVESLLLPETPSLMASALARHRVSLSLLADPEGVAYRTAM